jgi:hypothetical protein
MSTILGKDPKGFESDASKDARYTGEHKPEKAKGPMTDKKQSFVGKPGANG